MRVYEDGSLWAQEFSIDATLKLADDGRFSYYESWHCYGAGYGISAQGNWRQNGDEIVLSFETAGEGLYFGWTAGQKLTAIDRTDSIELGGNYTMSLSQDSPREPAAPPIASEVHKPVEDGDKKKQPTIVKLYFKNGSVQERPLPNDSMFGLFTQTYYRLVDEHGQTTNMFERRQNSENQDSSVIEYEEMEMSSGEDADY